MSSTSRLFRSEIVRILALHLELELGQIRLNRIVPPHAPLVHQHPDERRGERLRRRGDEERRIRRDGRLLLDVRNAESSSEDHFFAAHDREHYTRHVQIDAEAIDLRRQAVEPLRERGSGLLWRDDGLRECIPGQPKKAETQQQQGRNRAHGHVDRHELQALSGVFATVSSAARGFSYTAAWKKNTRQASPLNASCWPAIRALSRLAPPQRGSYGHSHGNAETL